YSLLPLSYNDNHTHLHSFPTRRSSDLKLGRKDEKPPESVRRFSFHRQRPIVGPEERSSRPRAGSSPMGSRRSTMAEAGTKLSLEDRKSTRLNSSHQIISYAVFCLKKKK